MLRLSLNIPLWTIFLVYKKVDISILPFIPANNRAKNWQNLREERGIRRHQSYAAAAAWQGCQAGDLQMN
jgi:hypothetical protein